LPDERSALADGLRRLSPESRYRRFFPPLDKLSEAQLTYLTEVAREEASAASAARSSS
jgi:hypothetical protein